MEFRKPRVNRYPFWLYQQVIPHATELSQTIVFELPKAFNYLLQKIYVAYPTVGAAQPTTFQDPRFRLFNNSFGKKFNDIPVSFIDISSPSHLEVVAAGNPPNNSAVAGAMSINETYLNITNIEFVMTNFQGVGKPAFIDMLIHGDALLNEDLIDASRWD